MLSASCEKNYKPKLHKYTERAMHRLYNQRVWLVVDYDGGWCWVIKHGEYWCAVVNRTCNSNPSLTINPVNKLWGVPIKDWSPHHWAATSFLTTLASEGPITTSITLITHPHNQTASFHHYNDDASSSAASFLNELYVPQRKANSFIQTCTCK